MLSLFRPTPRRSPCVRFASRSPTSAPASSSCRSVAGRSAPGSTGWRTCLPRRRWWGPTARGLREYVTVITYTGRPVVLRTAMAVVLRDAE